MIECSYMILMADFQHDDNIAKHLPSKNYRSFSTKIVWLFSIHLLALNRIFLSIHQTFMCPLIGKTCDIFFATYYKTGSTVCTYVKITGKKFENE